MVATEEPRVASPPPSLRLPYAGPTAVVGQVVQWYAKADRNSTPRAAVVTLSDGKGVLSLSVLHVGSPIMDSKPGVRHVDDPWNKEHPDPADRNGGWDYVVEAKPPKPPKVDLRTPKVTNE